MKNDTPTIAQSFAGAVTTARVLCLPRDSVKELPKGARNAFQVALDDRPDPLAANLSLCQPATPSAPARFLDQSMGPIAAIGTMRPKRVEDVVDALDAGGSTAFPCRVAVKNVSDPTIAHRLFRLEPRIVTAGRHRKHQPKTPTTPPPIVGTMPRFHAQLTPLPGSMSDSVVSTITLLRSRPLAANSIPLLSMPRIILGARLATITRLSPINCSGA